MSNVTESISSKSFSDLAIGLNVLAGESGMVDIGKLQSAIASSEYYSSFEVKVSSIIRSMIKNHAFRDGNKRTAVMMFRLLVAHSRRMMNYSNRELIDLFADIAANHYSVEEIRDKIFKNISEDGIRHWLDVIKRGEHQS
jgi:death-on-curing protein